MGYSDYTDAYSRSEIEMMKNFDPTLSDTGTGTFTTNMVETENMAQRNKEPPHNWYLLYLSGKTCLSQKYLLFCFGFIVLRLFWANRITFGVLVYHKDKQTLTEQGHARSRSSKLNLMQKDMIKR